MARSPTASAIHPPHEGAEPAGSLGKLLFFLAALYAAWVWAHMPPRTSLSLLRTTPNAQASSTSPDVPLAR